MKEKIKKIFSKILNILSNIFFVLLILIAFLVVYSSIKMKNSNDQTFNIFGYQTRIVVSGSMEKCEYTDVSNFKIKDIKTKSIILIKTVPEEEIKKQEFYKNVNIGDVLTFNYKYDQEIVITHRVVDKIDLGNGDYKFIMEGDNKNGNMSNGQQIIDTSKKGPNYIIGKVTATNYVLGSILCFIKTPIGIITIVIIPSIIIIIYEIIKMIKGSKKAKESN